MKKVNVLEIEDSCVVLNRLYKKHYEGMVSVISISVKLFVLRQARDRVTLIVMITECRGEHRLSVGTMLLIWHCSMNCLYVHVILMTARGTHGEK